MFLYALKISRWTYVCIWKVRERSCGKILKDVSCIYIRDSKHDHCGIIYSFSFLFGLAARFWLSFLVMVLSISITWATSLFNIHHGLGRKARPTWSDKVRALREAFCCKNLPTAIALVFLIPFLSIFKASMLRFKWDQRILVGSKAHVQ
jgi:hypothetical protein